MTTQVGWSPRSYRADVRRAMSAVRRDLFVLPADRELADADTALPIRCGQTISQPSLVRRMTELLELRPGNKVLEVGTGSGYQTAVLAELGYVEVYSVEIIPELAAEAAERLRRLGYTRVHLRCGDGYAGWPEHAPFDGIIVTAAPDHVPPPLLQQLAEGGRLVIPLGPRGEGQTLYKIERRAGEMIGTPITWVAFVPLTRPASATAKE